MGQKQPRILVVDDDPVVRDLVALWLQTSGYQCDSAHDAESAWEYLQRHEVELATLDIAMPGPSGIELLKRIRQSYPETEVVMLTAVQDAPSAIESLTLGAFAYLIKPVEAEELILQVQRALERRQWRRERNGHSERLEQIIQQHTQEIRLAYEETIHRLLLTSMYRGEETAGHLRRMGLFSEAIALAAGWPPARAEQLRLAAPMHDVGNIGIPDSILRKPDRLSIAEFELMKTHTVIGGRMLDAAQGAVLQMAQQIALGHHERWGGGGYPRGLAAIEIPEPARIVCIADVYDALTHDRHYRRALPADEALRIMRNGRGTQFDPRLLDAFFAALPDIRRIAAESPDDPPPTIEAELLELMLGEERPPAWEPARALALCDKSEW